MQQIKIRLTGVAALLMHNNRTVDRFDPITKQIKEITKKTARNKTDEDELELRRLEWSAGLYLDEKGEPCLTANMVLGMTVAGARKARLGKHAEAAVYELQATYSLKYDGPRTVDELYAAGKFEDVRSVKLSKDKSIMRTRPIFGGWSCDISLMFDETVLDRSALIKAIEVAGEQIGIGDYRPRFGRFTIELLSS